MISIIDQLKGMRAAMPPRKDKELPPRKDKELPPRKDKELRRRMLGHEIDAIVLASVERWPGTTAAFIHGDLTEFGLTKASVDESLRSLVRAGSAVVAQRKPIEKAHYWPARLSDLAAEWGQDFAKRVTTFLDEHGDASTKDVAEFIGYQEGSARRALHRTTRVESYAVKAGKSRKLMWRNVK